MNPLQLAFYKGVKGNHGAVQFNVQRPHYYAKSFPKAKNFDGKYLLKVWETEYPGIKATDLTSREGAVFMEICSTKGPNEYDWENKVVMALSITDLGKLLTVLEGILPETKIYHDPGAKSATAGKIRKTLYVNSPNGLTEGVIVTVTQTKSDGAITHKVPLSADEARVLAACIRPIIPATLAWV